MHYSLIFHVWETSADYQGHYNGKTEKNSLRAKIAPEAYLPFLGVCFPSLNLL